ncbi:MAG: AMP-binding protein [Candidatus Binatia bacterium]
MIELPKDRWTLVDLLREQARRQGDRTFTTFKEGASLSFAGLDRESDALAAGFAALGVTAGDRVFGLLWNEPELLLAFFATNKLGAIFVPINTELRGAFLEHQVKNSAPRIVIVSADLVKSFEGVTLPPEVEHVFVVPEPPAPIPDAFAGKRLRPLTEAFDRSKPPPEVTIRPSDVSTVMYTSGTTGPSKGVLMPHAHCTLMGYTAAKTLGLREDDLYYVCMPLFHANGLFMQTIGSLWAGTPTFTVRRFSATAWLDDVRSTGATVTNGLGVMPEFIFRQPPTPNDRDHRLRTMMAVPIAAEWGSAFEKRFGVKLFQGFGMTEINIVAYSREKDPLEPGCAGAILDDWFEVKIVDPETDEFRETNVVGEIVVRPKLPYGFMAGYFRMPEKTIEAWRNLWFHTGDAGKLDEEGRLHFVDRIKDCIRRRGENISSFEVEQVLNAHPAIAESAVFAVKADDGGREDEVKACIVLRGGASLPFDELVKFCEPRMPKFAVPRFVEIVAELPKTATGKLQKEGLRRAGIGDGTWDRMASRGISRR